MNSLRYALRQATKRPGFSLIVVLMLAPGIGSTTAVFSIFHAILLEPLPVPEPERLVNVTSPGPKWGARNTNMAGDGESVFSYPMFRDLEAQQDVFTGIAAHTSFSADLAHEGRTMSASGMLVSGEYFPVLGTAPALGRLIGPRDEPAIGESPVVVLSHAYWQSQFGGNPDVLGKTLTVNGAPLTIIGIAADGFGGTTIGTRAQVFVPLSMRWRIQPTAARDYANRRSYWLYLFARLGDGVSVEQAESSVSALYSGILNEIEVPLNTNMPEDLLEQFRHRTITLEPGALGQSFIRSSPGDTALTLLLGVTGLVLLIACANIASLLLARGASRQGEIAVRASVGASRWQLVRQLLTETAVLAAIGGAASLPVAAATLAGIVALLPAAQATAFAFEISPAAVMFAIATTFVTLFVFGLLPALRASRTNPDLVVKGQPGSVVRSHGALRLSGLLATMQIALSTILLALAGLFVQSLLNIGRVNLGMSVDSVTTFFVSPGRNGYGEEQTMAFLNRLEEELAAEPGVLDASSASVPVLMNAASTRTLTVEDFASGPGIDSNASINEVGDGFFNTLSIPLLAGRDFTRADRVGAPSVAIVNRRFAEKFNLGEDPIGKRFAIGNAAAELDIEIVGLVGDSKYDTVKNAAPPQFFLPRYQNPNLDGAQFYLRSSLGDDASLAAVPGAVARIDPNVPVGGVKTVRTTVADNVYLDRMIAILSAAFAALATLLAGIGLYGMLAYGVSRRTREIGLRLALGASPSGMHKLVVRQLGRMAIIGGSVGVVLAIGLGKLVESLLFGVLAFDPATLIATIVILGVVVLGAGFVPARRAAKTAPMHALRYE